MARTTGSVGARFRSLLRLANPQLAGWMDAYELGSRLEQAGDFVAAEATYLRAFKEGHAASGYRLGVLRERRGDLTAAKVAYRRSSRLGDADATASLARLLEELQSSRRQAAEANHRSGQDDYESGLCLERCGDLVAAEAAFLRAYKAGHAAGGYRFGLLRERWGDRAAARVAYRRSSRLGDADATASLARLLEDREREREQAAAAASPSEFRQRKGPPARRRSNRPVQAPEQTSLALEKERAPAVLAERGTEDVQPLVLSADVLARGRLRDAIDAAGRVLCPPLVRYLTMVYGPNWLDKVKANRTAQSRRRVRQGKKPLPHVDGDSVANDARTALKIIAYDPALSDPFAQMLGRTRRLIMVADGVHHSVGASEIDDNIRVLEQVCHIAARLPGRQ